MNVQKVMARFLPLMDLAILLLGMFMVVISIAKFNDYNARVTVVTPTTKADPETPEDQMVVQVYRKMKFIPVYGCCKTGNGREAGHCYQLESNMSPSNEIRRDTDEDIKKILDKLNCKEGETPIVCLITFNGAWDPDWSSDKIRELEKTWNCGRIYRVLNMVNLPFNE